MGSSGVDYFPFEAAQLTDAVIANLTSLKLANASLFESGDAATARTSRHRTRGSSPACKAFPGDSSCPDDILCFILDLALGGALIEGVPVAAPYFSDRPQYDTAQCAEITEKWQSPPF